MENMNKFQYIHCMMHQLFVVFFFSALETAGVLRAVQLRLPVTLAVRAGETEDEGDDVTHHRALQIIIEWAFK